MKNIDPDNFNSFQIPNEILNQLYEFTGGSNEGSKGFMIAYTDQNGSPMIFCRAGSQIVEMGIRKALEKYLIEIENVDSPFDITGDQE